MAKKPKLDFNLYDVLSAIEAIHDAGVLEEPIEIDEGDPDTTVKNFVEAFSGLDDAQIKSLPTSKDILNLYNKELPDRFFPTDDDSGEASDGETDEAAEGDKSDDPSDGVEANSDSNEVEGSGDEPEDEKEFKPECPQFGEFKKGDDTCAECKKEYPQEYKLCVASVAESDKAKKTGKSDKAPKAEKPKVEKGKEEKTAKKDKEDKKEKVEKAEKKGKEDKKEKVEKEAEVPKEKKAFRVGKPKTDEEKKEKVEEKQNRRKSLAPLTGRKIADYFRRVAIGGMVNECVVESTKRGLTTTYVNEAVSIFARVVSSFSIPFIGEFAIGDISKIIKFCSSIGDGEVDIEVTEDRFVMKSSSNKVQLLLSTPGVIQTVPEKNDDGSEQDIDEIVDGTNSTTTISLDTGKDIIFDAKLIKSDVMFVVIEDESVFIVGGDNSSDRFKIELKKPEFGADVVDRDLQISSQDMAAVLGIASLSDQPLELLFSCDEEYGVVLRQGEDIWAINIQDETAE